MLQHMLFTVSDTDDGITALPTMEEIHSIMINVNGNSVVAPDDYNGFYTSRWDIIKDDLCSAIAEFFSGFPMPRSWTSTLLVTIPKVEKTTGF